MLNRLMHIIHQGRRWYWWLVRPQTRGIRGIVLNPQNDILLVRHRYEQGWYLPGGKVKKQETPTDALKREIKEETGISLVEIERRLGTYASEQEYKRDTIDVFVARTSESPREGLNVEVEETKFFPLNNLPADLSPATRRRLAEYRGESTPSNKW